MLFESQFRRPEEAHKLLDAIRTLAGQLPPTRIMEVCGTHTMAIAKSGLRGLLPPHVELISGPGCPVCVTPASVMDTALELASRPGVTLATYGDLLRVPGSKRGDDLRRRMALGADVRVVYSPMDALTIAEQESERQVVFLGVGFETTAPGTAIAVQEAKSRNIRNFSLLSLLKTTIPALRTLVKQDDLGISGFFCPGHVATIVGADAFRFLPEEFGLCAVVAGFENGDLLASTTMLLRQCADHSPRLENEYIRAVSPQGNPAALAVMDQTFVPCGALWRGLGYIPDSGLCLREEYADFDAEQRFGLAPPSEDVPSPCRCGDVICGRIPPDQCPLFGKTCTPEDPVGPCMVSGEGSCAATYHYGRIL